jgi:hypothetical protein
MNQQAVAIVIAGVLIAAAIMVTNHWTLSMTAGENWRQTLRMNRWTGSIVQCGPSAAAPFELRCPIELPPGR